MWRALRIGVLLLILLLVTVQAWLDQHRTTHWQRTVWVGAFAFNGDGSAASAAQLQSLRAADLEPVANFIGAEAHRYGVALDAPVQLRLFPAPATLPPLPPQSASLLPRILWSLQLRWYRWRTVNALPRSAPQIALFLLYHDPEHSAALPHSTGLQRGLTGIVHLYAGDEARAENNIVIAHELLHTFGATDKYDLATNVPRFPDGYAEPARLPRFPQLRAEIMAGRIPISADSQVMAADFTETVIGPLTAREIGWSAGT
jgi:hypothetical protein